MPNPEGNSNRFISQEKNYTVSSYHDLKLKEENEYLKNVIFELKNTLEYYSNPKTYEGKPCGYEWGSSIELDKGDRARGVLKKYIC